MKKNLNLLMATLLFAAGLAAGSAAAQPASDEHTEHHPEAAAQSGQPPPKAGENASMAAGAGGSAMPGAQMAAGMGEMMKRMGKPPRKELYPSLMYLPDLPSAQQVQITKQAHARMTSGTQLMSRALGAMSTSAARNDYAGLQDATERMRQGLAQFESGLAAHRALAEGNVPRNVALRWFKSEMNLTPATGAETSWNLFGGPVFHWVSMGIVAAFTLAMSVIYFARSRRARALAAQLVTGRSSVLPQSALGLNVAPATPAMVPPAQPPKPASTALPLVPLPSTTGSWSGQLRVAHIFQETPDVKTFRLAATVGEDLPFTFEPGQFLTVAVTIEGKTVKRSYSIASSPCCRGWCEITVKQAPGGAVSMYLHEQVSVGGALSASGPYGRFTFRGETPSVLMIAGGVGITPLMSSIRFLTDQSWPGEIFLIYACARLDKVIFREELEYLSPRHPNLHVVIVLSDEPSQSWSGERGLVSAELLARVVPELSSRRVHLCGPPPMMDAVKKVLAGAGVAAEQIRIELFLAPERPSVAQPLPANARAATSECTFTRSGKKAPLTPEKTVLEAAEEVGVVIAYSCRQGFCGECKTRLLSGQVTMEVEDGLSSPDKAAGYILACQAKSQSSVAVEA